MKAFLKTFGIFAALGIVLLLATVGYDALTKKAGTKPATEASLEADASLSDTLSDEETMSREESIEADQKAAESRAAEEIAALEAQRAALEAEKETPAPAESASPEEVPATDSTGTDKTTTASTKAPDPTQTPAPASDTNLAPDFSFTKDGTTVKLSDFYGKPTVLNFYCTWCGPCMYEMPFMQSAYERYGSEINFLIVDLLMSDSVEEVNAMYDENGYTFPKCFDNSAEGYSAYGISFIPKTYFISASGEIVDSHSGNLSDQQSLDAELDSLLGR